MKDHIEQDRLEAEKYANRFIEHVNDDHTDIISFPREVGCRIRDHIETLRCGHRIAPPAIGGEATFEEWWDANYEKVAAMQGPRKNLYYALAEAAWNAALAKAPQAAAPDAKGDDLCRQGYHYFSGDFCTACGMQDESLGSKKEVEG